MGSPLWTVLIPFGDGMDGSVSPSWDLCWGRACRANLAWLQAVPALPTWVLLLCYAESFCVSHCMEVVGLGVSAVVLNQRSSQDCYLWSVHSAHLGQTKHRTWCPPPSVLPPALQCCSNTGCTAHPQGCATTASSTIRASQTCRVRSGRDAMAGLGRSIA